MTDGNTMDTTTIRREIERRSIGRPQIWVLIEVESGDYAKADAIADGLARAVQDELENGSEEDE